jgi:hypothetical protein
VRLPKHVNSPIIAAIFVQICQFSLLVSNSLSSGQVPPASFGIVMIQVRVGAKFVMVLLHCAVSKSDELWVTIAALHIHLVLVISDVCFEWFVERAIA